MGLKGRVGSALATLGLLFASVAVALAAGEGILRLKNASMRNYDIEMWRYAKELKHPSDIAVLGHEHVPSKSAHLESVDIRINDMGLRGGPVPPPHAGQRRILFLGSSVTLGWGVPEAQTMTALLEKMLRDAGEDAVVMNAGIGNYNAIRYVTRFERRLTGLQPTDIVVHYFLRDAEHLDSGGGNFLLRHSELAVTLWIAATRYLGKTGEKSLEEHYREVYRPESPGYREMTSALHALARYAHAHGIRIYLAMTPDVHDLVDYKFGYIHETMRRIAAQEGYRYVDLLPAMRDLTPSQLWSMPGDPHPNALGHKLMAEALFPALKGVPGGDEPAGARR
jgi:lysophospholipase L1-like esterase